MKARRITVAIGDVFCEYSGDLVVIGHDGAHAVCRPTNGGRLTKIRKTRLQQEYDRASERRAARAHKALARLAKGAK